MSGKRFLSGQLSSIKLIIKVEKTRIRSVFVKNYTDRILCCNYLFQEKLSDPRWIPRMEIFPPHLGG